MAPRSSAFNDLERQSETDFVGQPPSTLPRGSHQICSSPPWVTRQPAAPGWPTRGFASASTVRGRVPVDTPDDHPRPSRRIRTTSESRSAVDILTEVRTIVITSNHPI